MQQTGFDKLIARWMLCGFEDREAFLMFLRLAGHRVEAHSLGGGDVDRSATRASSAVEVGATNSPDGATISEPCLGHATGCSSLAAREADESAAPNSNPQPKTSGNADKAETVPPPTVSAALFTNPRCQHPETCHLAHSRNECFDCNLAWSKRPKDEQVRLWAEAVQAARAA